MRSSLSLLGLIVASVLLGACGASLAPASNDSMASPAATAAPLDSQRPSSTPSSTPAPTGSNPAAPKPAKSLVGSVVTTLADDGLTGPL